MFRGAVRGDLPQILKIYAHARAVMKASGNPTQWGDDFPPQELLEEDIDSNRLFLYVVNGQIEAVFAFILGADPTYAAIEDGQWLDDTLPYGTVHRLASAGKHKGVASAVLDWSMEHCQSLRADTHADNKIMQHLLEKTALPAAASSMWQTARPALPTRSLPPPSRWVENRIHPQRAPVCGCRACHAGLRTQAFLFAPARSALRRSTVTEKTKPRMAKPVLATNTDQRKTPMDTDLNANL